MTSNKRIALNVAATYCRSLLAMFCGIFTSRWALMSLGDSDYGLFGVIGSLAVFITFFNGLLGASASRYFAFYIGQDSAKGENNDFCESRRWFSIAVMIHIIASILLMVIGYPIGVWAIRSFLTIPADRIGACVDVFRWVCASSFVGMISVPFTAMYTAKQYIAEMTAYSLVSIFINIIALYWMVTHEGDWLVFYSMVVCVSSVLPSILVMARARFVIPECRFSFRASMDLKRIKDLAAFTSWNALGGLGYLLRGQGIAILVNKFFGPSINASMTIANTVNGQASTLSQAMTGAFMPAITTACGAGDLVEMRKMTFRACKFGVLLVLVFLVPLSLEIDYILKLWLKTPPVAVNGLCLCMMAMLLAEKITIGHGTAIHAMGKISLYQICFGGALLLTIPFSWACVVVSGSVYGVVHGMTGAMCLASLVRVVLAKRIVGLSIRYWFFYIVAPIASVAGLSALAGWSVIYMLSPSLIRVICVTIVANTMLIPLSFFLVLDVEERSYLKSHLRRLLKNYY